MRNVATKATEGKTVFCGIDLHSAEMVAAGIKAAVVAPTEIEKSVRGRVRKTDREDARRLLKLVRSHVLADGDLPAVWIPDKGLRDDREIVRCRLKLGDDLARVKNRIHGLLKRHGARRPEGIKTLWTQKFLTWLEGLAKLLPMWAGRTLSSHLRELRFFLEERDRLDEALAELAKTPRYAARVKALTEVPGVGDLSAMVFLTEMGDPTRFTNRKKVGSWLGLTPRTHESGEATDRKGRISRLGPGRVRKVLNRATWVWRRYEEEVADWFRIQTVDRGKPRKKVIVALMRKLGILLWHRALTA